MSWWIPRCSRRSARSRATRSRWVRPGSSSPASVVSAPGNTGFRSALGPRIFIPAAHLDETRLLGFGARAEYEAFLRLPSEVAAEAAADRYRATLRPERVRVRTVTEDQENLNETLSRLTGYLGLVALIALLLGGIGVASAVVVFIRQRMETIAVLRCLGATGGRVFAIYGVEAALDGPRPAACSARAVGIGVQRLLPGLLAGLLPVDVRLSISWPAVALGVGMGLWVAVAFALLPLLAVRRVPPLAALRRPFERHGGEPRDWWRWVGRRRCSALSTVAAGRRSRSGTCGRARSSPAGVGGGAAPALARVLGLIRAARRWLPPRLALPLAAGTLEPAPPLEPDR